MLWQTHIRIANEVLRKLGMPKSSIEASNLREGSIAPDKWKDYPHHHGKSGSIKKHLLDARRLFLNGDSAKAYFCLGVALHYVQDSYTSLSSRSSRHIHWEQQIEQSYFTDDLESLVAAAFRDRPDRREEYTKYAVLLSHRIEGKESTLQVASAPGPGLSFWSDRIWGRPHVDLNFALRASLVIAESVFGPKTSPKLEKELRLALADYEALLKKTELVLANEIIELVKKRDELKKRRRKNGVFQTLRSYFLTLLSKIQNLRAGLKFNGYEQRKHLKEVARAYREATKKLVSPHSGWYNFTIPQIDINSVEKELLSTHEASEYFRISEYTIKELIKKRKISCYYVQNKELIRASELGRVLWT